MLTKFPNKTLFIYTSSGKQIQSIENCEYGFNRNTMTSGFSYPVSEQKQHMIDGYTIKNFLYFKNITEANGQHHIAEMKKHCKLFINGELFYEGKGYHYISQHEALDGFYFEADGQIYEINHSSKLPDDVFLVIEEQILDV